MTFSLSEIRISLCMILGSIAYWLGGWDIMLHSLLILMLVDYLTGVMKGVYEKKLSSAIGFHGILRKIFMLSIVCVSFVLESIVGVEFPLRELVLGFFIANEGISIIENAIALRIPLPKKLVEVLSRMKEKEDHDETNSSN